jgi:hypothetical protein
VLLAQSLRSAGSRNVPLTISNNSTAFVPGTFSETTCNNGISYITYSFLGRVVLRSVPAISTRRGYDSTGLSSVGRIGTALNTMPDHPHCRLWYSRGIAYRYIWMGDGIRSSFVNLDHGLSGRKRKWYTANLLSPTPPTATAYHEPNQPPLPSLFFTYINR